MWLVSIHSNIRESVNPICRPIVQFSTYTFFWWATVFVECSLKLSNKSSKDSATDIGKFFFLELNCWPLGRDSQTELIN